MDLQEVDGDPRPDVPSLPILTYFLLVAVCVLMVLNIKLKILDQPSREDA